MASEEAEHQIRELNEQLLQLYEQGKYRESLPLARRVCERARRVLGNDDRNTAACLSNLGLLLRAAGDLPAARLHHEEALEICRRILGNNHADTADSLNNVGDVLWAMGDLAAARPYVAESLEIRLRLLSASHPDTTRSLNNLDLLLCHMGDVVAAAPYLAEALTIRLRTLGNNHADTATTLNNVGVLLQAVGDLTRAQKCFEKALAIRRRILGNHHPHTTGSLNNLGFLLRAMGDLVAARPYLEQALEGYRRTLGNDHPDTAMSLFNLAALEAASGRIDEAVALTCQAAAIDDRRLVQIFSITSDQQRLLFLRQLHRHQAGLLSLVFRDLPHSPEAVQSAFDLVLRRKAFAAEALAAQRDAVLGGRHPELRESFEEFTALRRRIARKTLAGPDSGETLADHEQTLHQLRQEQQQRETELARQIPEVSLEQHLRKAERRAVALGLEEGVALIEFVRFRVFDFHAVPDRRVDQLAQEQKEMEQLNEQLAEQKQRFLDQLAEQEKESLRQKQRLADQVIEQQKEIEMVKEEKQRRLSQVIEQRNEIEKLKSELVEMKRVIDSKPASAAKPPETVLLYYRVPAQRCRQVEYARIDEVTTYLRSLHISYVRGREYKDSGLSPLRAPIAIKPLSWTSYNVKNVGHRDRVVTKMRDWGIETATERPDDIDD